MGGWDGRQRLPYTLLFLPPLLPFFPFFSLGCFLNLILSSWAARYPFLKRFLFVINVYRVKAKGKRDWIFQKLKLFLFPFRVYNLMRLRKKKKKKRWSYVFYKKQKFSPSPKFRTSSLEGGACTQHLALHCARSITNEVVSPFFFFFLFLLQKMFSLFDESPTDGQPWSACFSYCLICDSCLFCPSLDGPVGHYVLGRRLLNLKTDALMVH